MDIVRADKLINDREMPHIWCAGCGAGIALGSILRSVQLLGYTREETVIVTGIGCCGKADDYVTTNAFHGTHGRALAFATGIKVAKPSLKVIVIMGDGDGATIGGNHFIHSARRNIDLTAVVINNSNYGMTGGQFSATTPHGKKTSTSAFGNPERAFDLCELASAAGANYVARGTVYHINQLDKLMQEAIKKPGFSMVEVVSPCPTHFGKKNRMGDPVAMMNWLKDHGFTAEQYEKLSDQERNESFKIGKLAERNAPDYNTQYEAVRQLQLDSLKK